MDSIVNGNFPTHPEQVWGGAVAQLAVGKASHPDGIPAEILGIVAKRRPEILLNVQHVPGGRRVQQRLEDGIAHPH